MRPLQGIFPPQDYPDLLVGLSSPDDSAVYRLDENRAIITTVDFFTPVVDDPYAFGAIAAANALSDVYAMGGRPLMAINLAAFPENLDLEVMSAIFRGGADKIKEAGAVIAGGHTITDKEPKYGLSVTGEIHPRRIIAKSGAQPGDVLILTKPLGTGVITTALKRDQAEDKHVQAAIAGMSHLNRFVAEQVQEFNVLGDCVHAMTDVTGYSLLGHGHEMAHLSHVNFRIQFDALLWYPGALQYGKAEIFAGGLYRNHDYYRKWVTLDAPLTDWQELLLYDPQTSGGLLMAVNPEKADNLLQTLCAGGEQAAIIGTVENGDGHLRIG